jgi:spore coat protein U-like protein
MTHPTLRPLLAALSLAASLLGSSRALAISSCTISSVTSVAFGAYDPFSGSPLDSAGSLTYSCVGVGGSDTILIQLGRGSSSSFFPRRMNNGGAALDSRTGGGFQVTCRNGEG